MGASDRFIIKTFKNVSENSDPWSNSEKLINEARNSTNADFYKKLCLVLQANVYNKADDYKSLSCASKLYKEFFKLENIDSYRKDAQGLLKAGAAYTYMKLCLQEENLENKFGLTIQADELLKDQDVIRFIKEADNETDERYHHYHDVLNKYRVDKRQYSETFRDNGFTKDTSSMTSDITEEAHVA